MAEGSLCRGVPVCPEKLSPVQPYGGLAAVGESPAPRGGLPPRRISPEAETLERGFRGRGFGWGKPIGRQKGVHHDAKGLGAFTFPGHMRIGPGYGHDPPGVPEPQGCECEKQEFSERIQIRFQAAVEDI